MEFDMVQADAFAERVFGGNPAAVLAPMADWLPDETLQAIALENNLSETAYLKKTGDGRYDLRWFTPAQEVPLCGHATLAAAHVLWTEFGESAERIVFETMSGPLYVARVPEGYAVEFPADRPVEIAAPAGLEDALGVAPAQVWQGQYLLAVLDTAEQVRALAPDMTGLSNIREGALRDCVLVTAPGDEGCDFVSRFFGPTQGIPEDPATGSAHCLLTPYWADRLGRTAFTAFQASPRGAKFLCRLEGERVELVGGAVTYLRGRISL